MGHKVTRPLLFFFFQTVGCFFLNLVFRAWAFYIYMYWSGTAAFTQPRNFQVLRVTRYLFWLVTKFHPFFFSQLYYDYNNLTQLLPGIEYSPFTVHLFLYLVTFFLYVWHHRCNTGRPEDGSNVVQRFTFIFSSLRFWWMSFFHLAFRNRSLILVLPSTGHDY